MWSARCRASGASSTRAWHLHGVQVGELGLLKLGHLLELGCALLRLIFGMLGPVRLAQGPDKTRAGTDRSQHQRANAGGDRSMPAGELAKLVQRARRSGHDRFIAQIATHVRGQFRCRLISTVGLLLQRPGDDGVEVPAKQSIHRAQRRGVVLANHA